MYFILTGKVDILVDGWRIVSLLDGAYFGELAFIANALRTASIQAVQSCEMYRLTRQDFHRILKDFRDMNERIEALVVDCLQDTNGKVIRSHIYTNPDTPTTHI